MVPEKLLQLGQLSQDLAHGKASYSPQSATIQGILKDMYNTFTNDLESMTSDEAKGNRDFEDFTATKLSELITLQADLKKKSKQKIEAEVMLAEAMQAYDDTEQQMKADAKFFDATKETCTAASEEWSDRKKLIATELAGVKKALEILSSDKAKTALAKALPSAAASSFLQVSSISDVATAQQKALEILQAQARPAHSLRLARLASQVELATGGHFDAAIGSIAKMITLLKKEAAEDLEKYDECKKEYQEIKSSLADLEWKIEKSNTNTDKIKAETIEKEDEKKKAGDELKDVQGDMTEMKKVRKEENEAFTTGKKEDEAAIELLGKAKDALTEYYDKHAELFQRSSSASSDDPLHDPDVAPEFKLSKKTKNKNQAGGVVGMMELVIEDLEGGIEESAKAEKANQEAYEKNLAAAEELEDTLDKRIVSLSGAIALLKDDKKDEGDNLSDLNKDKKDVDDHKDEIRPECDSMLDKYESRTKKRQAEMDGLNAARSYLKNA